MVLKKIIENKEKKKKSIGVLLDPDKLDYAILANWAKLLNQYPVDFILVGGSLISSDFMAKSIAFLKKETQLPVILFPGNSLHIDPQADAILFLSLISGRNPEFLIGQHVLSAPALKRSQLEILPTGYMLVDGGKATTVSYISNTTPLPNDKPDVAAATAMAGEMLGLKLLYLDAGSGAENPVDQYIIRAVQSNTTAPLIVGGGINSAEKAYNAWKAGADVVIVGNALEKDPDFLNELMHVKDSFQQSDAIKI